MRPEETIKALASDGRRRPIHVLVGIDPAEFRRSGGEDPGLPRQPLAYPFLGGLRERGWDVELHRIPSEGRGRTASALVQGFGVPALRKLEGPVLALGMSAGELLLLASGGRGSGERAVVVQTAESGHLRGAKRSLRDLLVRRALRRAGLAIFQIADVAAREQSRLKLDPGAVAVWPVGVDARYFAPAPAFDGSDVRPELKRIAGRPFAVVVGDQQRDEALLAGVFSGCDLPLVRVTHEPRVEAFWTAERRRRDGPGVFCSAGIAAAELRHLYQRAAVALNIADGRWQPAGYTVAMEAMACGAPLVMNRGLATGDLAQRAGGAPPFVELDAGAGPAEIRAAIRDLADDAARRSRVAKAGRAFVERRLTIEQSADRIDEILRARWPR